MVQATNLGTAAPGAGVTNIMTAGNYNLVGGGGGAAGTTNMNFRPDMVGVDTNNGGLSNATFLVSGGSNGLRQMNVATEMTTSIPCASNTWINARVTGPIGYRHGAGDGHGRRQPADGARQQHHVVERLHERVPRQRQRHPGAAQRRQPVYDQRRHAHGSARHGIP